MDLLTRVPHQVSASLNDKIFLFYGEGGTRKTTVAAGFDGMVLGAFEIGYKFIDGVVAEPLQKWADMKRFVRELARPEVQAKFKTVAIDTITLAYQACYDYILAQYGVEDPGDIPYGKGWRFIRKEFEKTILSIPQMGYGLILIAHSNEYEDEEKVATAKVDIDKRPAAIIKGLADFILYLHKEYRDGTEKVADNETVYAYSKLVDIETKTRSRYFPARFEFTYDNLQKSMDLAIAEQKKVEGITTVDESESLHKIEEEGFENLQKTTLELATRLISTEAQETVKDKLLEILEGTPLSQTTKFHKEKLVALRESLYEIEGKLK